MHSTMMPKTAVWLLETALFPPAARPAPRLITGRWLFYACHCPASLHLAGLQAVTARRRFARVRERRAGRVTGRARHASRVPAQRGQRKQNGGLRPPCQFTLSGRPPSQPVALLSVYSKAAQVTTPRVIRPTAVTPAIMQKKQILPKERVAVLISHLPLDSGLR